MRESWLLAFPILVALGATAGCQATNQAAPNVIDILRNDILTLRQEVARLEADNRARTRETSSQLMDRMHALSSSVDALDLQIAQTCAFEAIEAKSEIDSPVQTNEIRRIVVSNDKMLVGEIENVWVEPPGFEVSARVDTGADSSSLHAEAIMEFERDGDDWVRFDIVFNELSITVERPVEKYVRVYQQSDKEGTRRAVVAMRVFLGDVQDTFEFTLADRSHLEHVMILGRNFLTDIALVDVGQQYMQPIYRPGER